MYDSKRAVAVMLAVLAVVGLAVAPTAAVAVDGGSLDGEQVTNGTDQVENGTDQVENGTNDTSVQADHGPYPHEVCTDLLKLFHEETPYDQLIWVTDLPKDAQPPGVPWSVVTPRAIGSIVVAATPDQCDVQDPNDPSWDPTREGDNVDPDGDVNASQGEDREVLVIVEGTLDNTSEGPSAIAEADLEITENGTLDPNTRVNDGEKEYGVDPQLKYWSDGTTYFETDVYVIGLRLGGEMDCFGEECNTESRGLPKFVEFPALPSHTDRERSGGNDEGSDGSGDSTDSDGSDGGGGGPSADDTSDSDDGGADSSDGSDGADPGTTDSDTDSSDGSSDGDGPSTDGTDGDGSDGGSTDTDANQQQQATDDGGDQTAERAGFGGAKGLGVLVALVVFILGAGAIVPRD